jgi:hypothetical protein
MTTPITETTLPIGATIAGPYATGDATGCQVMIDRTVAGGLNELDATSTLDATIQSSPDGTAWNDEGATQWVGGIFTDHHGQVNANTIGVGGFDPAATMVRLVAVVGGPVPITVTGSVTVT